MFHIFIVSYYFKIIKIKNKKIYNYSYFTNNYTLYITNHSLLFINNNNNNNNFTYFSG